MKSADGRLLVALNVDSVLWICDHDAKTKFSVGPVLLPGGWPQPELWVREARLEGFVETEPVDIPTENLERLGGKAWMQA